MTWNPKDVLRQRGQAPSPATGMADAPPPLSTDQRLYDDLALPTVCEAMGWDSAVLDDELSQRMPMEVERELVNQGIWPERQWTQFRRWMLRGIEPVEDG